MVNEIILVTAAIIEQNRKYLITQRPDDGRPNSGEWEFPGGRVKYGEHPEKCLEREIEEELGIMVKTQELFGLSSQVYNDGRHVVLLGFYCKHISGDIQNKDIINWAYVFPKNMNKYNMSLTDLSFVERLKRLS